MLGIDPHPGLLESWGLPDSVSGLRSFSLLAVEAAAGVALGVKPQSALFERHGAPGIGVLAEVLAEARSAGLVTVLDAKRGDIGSTMAGYAAAYLGPEAPLAADALTVSPYLGFGSLEPTIKTALDAGRGVFVLCLTSNPEGRAVQHAVRSDGRTVAAAIASAAASWNSRIVPLGSVGLVVGATVGDGARQAGVDLTSVNGPLLAPGVGAQGAGLSDLRQVFGPDLRGVIVPLSRSVLAAGPTIPALRSALRAALTP